VFDDIFNTALLIARRDKNTGEDKEKIAEIQSGIIGFANFLMYGRFTIDDAIISSAKAALLASKIKSGTLEPIELYDNQDISQLKIKSLDYNFLNRFRKTLKPAFYYWHQLIKTIGIE
jgi:hypothetical protein